MCLLVHFCCVGLRPPENEIVRLKTEAQMEHETELAALRRRLEDEKAEKLRAVAAEIESKRHSGIKEALCVQPAHLQLPRWIVDSLIVVHTPSFVCAHREEANTDVTQQIERLRAALLQDRAKADAALRDQKRAEIEERITKVQGQILQETELALHEAALRWNALKRKVEEELRTAGTRVCIVLVFCAGLCS
jgi:hypothetical protein